jgi:hypothetical protein
VFSPFSRVFFFLFFAPLQTHGISHRSGGTTTTPPLPSPILLRRSPSPSGSPGRSAPNSHPHHAVQPVLQTPHHGLRLPRPNPPHTRRQLRAHPAHLAPAKRWLWRLWRRGTPIACLMLLHCCLAQPRLRVLDLWHISKQMKLNFLRLPHPFSSGTLTLTSLSRHP